MKAQIVIFLILCTACSPKLSSIDQGIKGQLLWLEGDLMPGPNKPENPPKPVQREIQIYELTNLNSVTKNNEGFFSDIPTDPVAVVQSDEEGKFSIKLPEGNYSVFVKEEAGLFANKFDGQGNINPVEIKSGEIAEKTIRIDYQAAY